MCARRLETYSRWGEDHDMLIDMIMFCVGGGGDYN